MWPQLGGPGLAAQMPRDGLGRGATRFGTPGVRAAAPVLEGFNFAFLWVPWAETGRCRAGPPGFWMESWTLQKPDPHPNAAWQK